ncbi:MAG: L-threonylcarbamoyladenylate synthase [Pseudomonadota bacterium]
MNPTSQTTGQFPPILQPDAQGLKTAAELLHAAGLVAFPTETVYGLGADAQNDHAVAGIFAAKNRPTFNPLIIHTASAETATRIAVLSPAAQTLADAFWPGPLTMVLPLREHSKISKLATAGLDTVAIRVPANACAQDLLAVFQGPIAAPSANPSGRVSPTTPAHVASGLGNAVGIILDGGPARVGLESTIVDLSTDAPTLLRPGGLSLEEVEDKIGVLATPGSAGIVAPVAPGQLRSHYAPAAPLRINATGPMAGESFLAFGPGPAADANLSETGDLTEAAANLFDLLHRLDALGRPIAVAPVPETGLGLAINDRLARAAAPRG